MKFSFKDLGVSAPILKAFDEMGFEKPTDVQIKAIPHALNEKDLTVMSKTGTGKTAVFGVAILQKLDPGIQGPQGLILTPTRELAIQVDDDLKLMSKYLPQKTIAIYGQHSMSAEIQALNSGVSIVAGTPGRVYDHIRQGNLKTKQIRFLVLDEADRMLDMGFIDQVIRILKTIPENRVTMLFSATIPDEIQKICKNYMKAPLKIEVESSIKTVDSTKQAYYRVNSNEKKIQLNRLLLFERPNNCLIFCNTRMEVDKVHSFLARKGYSVMSLHGDIPQNKRSKTISSFKHGKFCILVATDVAGRGIHIDDLSLVINYDLPAEKDSYIHRIGRTGRAGNIGHAISLVTSESIMDIYEIEEHIRVMIPEVELPPESFMQEQKNLIDQWIQMNSQKNVPFQETVSTPVEKYPKKHNYSRKQEIIKTPAYKKSENVIVHKTSPIRVITRHVFKNTDHKTEKTQELKR